MSSLTKYKKQLAWICKNKFTDEQLAALRETAKHPEVRKYFRNKYGRPADELRKERELDKQL